MTTQEYNRCVEQHADGLYRFILSNIRNEEDAKDIVQETFAKMWEHSKNVNSEKGKSYLFTAAYHNMIDKIRKEKRYTPIEDQHKTSFGSGEQYTGIQEILHEAINRLPEIQRAVILLRDYEGYSYQEIGKMTQLSTSQVKVYIFRARSFLKKYIGKLENVI